MPTMCGDQHHALALMQDRGIGAIWAGRARGWVWPADIRDDSGAAVAALYALARSDEGGGIVTMTAQRTPDQETTMAVKMTDIQDALDARGMADRREACPEPGCPEITEAHNLAHHLINSHRWTVADVAIFFHVSGPA